MMSPLNVVTFFIQLELLNPEFGNCNHRIDAGITSHTEEVLFASQGLLQ